MSALANFKCEPAQATVHLIILGTLATQMRLDQLICHCGLIKQEQFYVLARYLIESLIEYPLYSFVPDGLLGYLFAKSLKEVETVGMLGQFLKYLVEYVAYLCLTCFKLVIRVRIF